MSTRDFHKVLVANRGEIARRIFRTLREMGLSTVAVYSDADRDAPHVAEADEAVHIGPAPSNASYLDQDAVIAAAKETGAQAIHPGYGFLAENAAFAERCGDEGLIFIGPSPQAIRRMGDKAAAKKLAVEVGVPVLDGFTVDDLDAETNHHQAEKLGFPLLVKAAAGGGGKGMRIVAEPGELEEALNTARREAKATFGDGSLLIERLVVAPRHVEIQILGDAHGNLVHLFERDCSIQRRHQKVFEESPSPAVAPELRQRMGDAAIALARAVNYQGAGTVEFLLDAGGAFYFLEMNTRLQVEHPVTEAVTGLDLVRLQVDIAQGLPLPFEQDNLELTGHAIEARLYAEDPLNDFLPATGTVSLWTVPELPGLRVDSGVEQGSVIGIHYDPMLAKVITHGSTRVEALRRLHRGLSELAVGGLTTNREFLLATLEHEAFRTGEVDTGFIDRDLPPTARTQASDPSVLELHAIAATLHLFQVRRETPGPVPASLLSGWRNNRWRPQEQVFESDANRLTVHYVAVCYVTQPGDHFTIDVATADAAAEQAGDPDEPRSYQVRLVEARDGLVVAEVDGVRRRFRIGHTNSTGSTRSLSVHGLGRLSELQLVPRFPQRQASEVAGGCAAPMTGKVVEVRVTAGDSVTAGSTLVVLEAMKMEHQLQAQADGIVESVHVEAGQMVDPDKVLVVVKPHDRVPEDSSAPTAPENV